MVVWDLLGLHSPWVTVTNCLGMFNSDLAPSSSKSWETSAPYYISIRTITTHPGSIKALLTQDLERLPESKSLGVKGHYPLVCLGSLLSHSGRVFCIGIPERVKR